MKTKKKGFSIPELLAVIVIMGILVTIATASYNGISRSLKQRTYNNKVNLIKTKALEYAADNGVDVATISVAKLISEGYLEVENETDGNEKMTNPLGGYLDCYKVDINRNLDDYDVSVSTSEDCSLAETDVMASNIEVVAYAYDGEAFSNNNKLGTNKDIKWTNKDVYLYLNPASLSGNASQEMSITWSINGDNKVKTGNVVGYPSTDTNYANIYKLETLYLLNVNVVVKVPSEKGMLSKSVNIKIDKESPTVTLDTDASYESASKVITFNGSDGSGSGFSGYSYALTEKKEDTPIFNITNTDNKIEVYKNQKYYAYAKDAVGNISKPVEIDITNIDNSKPVCKNPKNNAGWTNVNYSYTFGCDSDHGSGCATLDTKETQQDEAEFKEVKWTIKDNVGNSRDCKTNVAVHVDKTAPTCEIQIDPSSKKGNNNWYINDVKLNLIMKDNMSGVSEYGITTNANAEYNGQKYASLTSDTDSNGVTYYGYVKDKAGNTNTCKITVKRLTETPSCTLASSGNVGNNGWYTSNVNITMNSSSKYVTGKNVNNTNRENYTLTSDTKGTTIKGIVTNDAGLTGDCSISVKRDTEAPSCNVNASGTMGQNNWYISNVAVSFASSDETSGVARYGLNANSTSYNNNNRQDLTWDTDGITYYGIVMDNAGNQRDCSKVVKRLATAPSCSINASGNKGWSDWYTSDVTNTISSNSPHVSSKRITNNNSDRYVINWDNDGTTVSGEVVNEAGLKGSCSNWTKRLAQTPSCSVNLDGTMGQNNWYISNINASVGSSSSHIVSSKITNNNSSNYTVNWDTEGITINGSVTNAAGTSASCSSWARRLTNPPTCSLQISGNKGNNNWYRSNVIVSMSTSGVGISARKISVPNGATYDNSYTLTYDTNYINVSGYVTNEAGLSGSCTSPSIRRDTTPPAATLRMKTTHHCDGYDVKYKTGEQSCFLFWCSDIEKTTNVSCSAWDSNNLSNNDNLINYLKNTGNKVSEIVSKGSRQEYDDVSTTEAELVCSDNMTTNVSYKIGSKYGSIYNLDSDSTARNRTNYTMSGTCTDEAGNTSSASKNFYRYEEEKYCEQTHTESTCNSTHGEVTNCEDGKNYTMPDGDNCGGPGEGGNYGTYDPDYGNYTGCNWSSGGSGSTGDCGHVNEVCDGYTDTTVSDGYYKCGDNKWR